MMNLSLSFKKLELFLVIAMVTDQDVVIINMISDQYLADKSCEYNDCVLRFILISCA